MRIGIFRASTVVALCSFAACNNPVTVTESPELQTGYWQARITVPGGDIDTGIEISRNDDGYQANLINGRERVRIREVSFSDGVLTLRFPTFNNEIRAKVIDGELIGDLTLVRRFGEIQVMPFLARPGNEPSQKAVERPTHDLSGRWAARFHEPGRASSPSIGEFVQRGSRLFGTFLNPNGDFRFLAGHVRGDSFKLSAFDGANAYLLSGEITGAGEIDDAHFWSATSSHQTWSAVRNEDVELPDAYARTFLKPGYDSLEFEFPDLEGTPVSLEDDKFAGKVVLVTLAGTWCPNCNDEARFLAPLYKKYHDQGLEIIALMYEHFEDQEIAAGQVRQFREKFDIQYDTLIAGISDKTEAVKTLPALSAILAFPTTIFIDRRGRVRRIHTGFSGPGTGEHYERLQQEFTTFINTLIAEPVGLIESLDSIEMPTE